MNIYIYYDCKFPSLSEFNNGVMNDLPMCMNISKLKPIETE